MAVVTESIGLAEHRPFTVHDLEAMPDDGWRYELIDGVLLVTPAPGWPHQEMSIALLVLLRMACPPDLRVLAGPFGVRTSVTNEVQPDVLVARYTDLTEDSLPVAPVLAVETLSRSTKLKDRTLKKAHYERIGVRSYWILDPSDPGGLEVYELDENGKYALVASVSGDDVLPVRSPFPVEVSPARLLDGLRPR
ncbi:MAG: Uma2 family endonuclease [Pseudonocardia sp.]|nr:Uma2 family endonuclease [Pseudonocardia sp.]